MKTIMVDARLGITMFNLSEEVIRVINGDFSECADGGPKFNIDDQNVERVVDIIRREAMTLNRVIVEISRVGTQIIHLRPRREEVYDPEVDEPEVDEDDNDLLEEQEERRDVREPERREPERRPAGIVPVEPSERPNPLSRDDSINMIAAALENEVSSLARNLRDKQREFERAWTRVINLKREIEEATAPVEGHPIINNLVTQVAEIERRENMINSIFFIDGFVVAYTDELSTDNEIDGARRKVGRMRIKVNLKPLIGNSSECPDPVIIENLDRKYYDGNRHWECGHVPSGGRGMCWGTAWELLFHAMTSRDLDSILEVIIRYIKNPNPADVWGRHMKHWPPAGE